MEKDMIVVPSKNLYQEGDVVHYHSFIYNGDGPEEFIQNCYVMEVMDEEKRNYRLRVSRNVRITVFDCDVEATKEALGDRKQVITYLVKKNN